MAPTSAPGALAPDLDGARKLASEGTVVPVVHTYVEDTETPVSARSIAIASLQPHRANLLAQ